MLNQIKLATYYPNDSLLHFSLIKTY